MNGSAVSSSSKNLQTRQISSNAMGNTPADREFEAIDQYGFRTGGQRKEAWLSSTAMSLRQS